MAKQIETIICFACYSSAKAGSKDDMTLNQIFERFKLCDGLVIYTKDTDDSVAHERADMMQSESACAFL